MQGKNATDDIPNLVAGRPQAAPLFGRLLLRLQAETRDVVAVALWERRGAGQPRGAREPTAATPDGDGRGEGRRWFQQLGIGSSHVACARGDARLVSQAYMLNIPNNKSYLRSHE